MEDDTKLPLKRVEHSLTQFSEVAVPHHLELLRQHRANILKLESRGEYRAVRGEQSAAARVAARLRALLGELRDLRAQLRPADLPRFDALTRRARADTLRAVADYTDLIQAGCRALAAGGAPPGSSPLEIARGGGGVEEPGPGAGAGAGSVVSSESVGVLRRGSPAPAAGEEEEGEQLLQLRLDERMSAAQGSVPRISEAALSEREAALRGWEALQREVGALGEVWAALHGAAALQRERLGAAAGGVTLAAGRVAAARGRLAAAERLRGGALALGGAAAGALLAGPLGLVLGAGVKAGACAALLGSALGAWGVRALRPAPPPRPDTPAPAPAAAPHDKQI